MRFLFPFGFWVSALPGGSCRLLGAERPRVVCVAVCACLCLILAGRCCAAGAGAEARHRALTNYLASKGSDASVGAPTNVAGGWSGPLLPVVVDNNYGIFTGSQLPYIDFFLLGGEGYYWTYTPSVGVSGVTLWPAVSNVVVAVGGDAGDVVQYTMSLPGDTNVVWHLTLVSDGRENCQFVWGEDYGQTFLWQAGSLGVTDVLYWLLNGFCVGVPVSVVYAAMRVSKKALSVGSWS